MGTRSYIGILESSEGLNKKVIFIYCHYDGYPEGVGSTLVNHYYSPFKVDQLIALGDLSSLGEEIGEKHNFATHVQEHPKWCLAYMRDRGERGCLPAWVSLKRYITDGDVPYKYLYNTETFEWECYSSSGEKLALELEMAATTF
jgi:hypothetical protein